VSLDEEDLLAVALAAAHAGADELRQRFGRDFAAQGVESKSSPTDLVSEADVASERAIRDVLAARRPGDGVLGEEGGASSGEGELRWIVDPLDGTINFLFGVPLFAVSVACEDTSGAVAGVVLDPVRGECFSATRGGPARLGEAVIHGRDSRELGQALVATGFGYDSSVRERQAAVVARVLPRVRDIRRGGAAALDLAWCACGRYDAYYERGVHTWDIAAGTLLATRAGLVVRLLPATGEDAAGWVAAPEALIDELYRLVVGVSRGCGGRVCWPERRPWAVSWEGPPLAGAGRLECLPGREPRAPAGTGTSGASRGRHLGRL
jgi:myo-inositol-1(or 4)-monophosphatase